MPNFDTYHQSLGVNDFATRGEIRAAVVGVAQQYHPESIQFIPDHLELIKRHAKERFHQINEAYVVLGDSATRKQYDELLSAHRDGRYRSPYGW